MDPTVLGGGWLCTATAELQRMPQTTRCSMPAEEMATAGQTLASGQQPVGSISRWAQLEVESGG